MTGERRGVRTFMAGLGALLAVVGLAITVVGLTAAAEPGGGVALCFGLVLVVVGLGGIAWEYAERRHLRHPPVPVLATAPTGRTRCTCLAPRAAARSPRAC